MSDKATLTFGDSTYPLNIITGTEKEKALDVRQLRKESGLITYDDGYGNTGSCESSVTFIDGDKGILRYRGYDIAELAEKANFLEVCLLLLNCELPTSAQLSTFEEKVGVAVGVTNDLISKYDAVTFVKIASEILGGKGGGGRKDFAQAGGTNINKIQEAFKAITNKIS